MDDLLIEIQKRCCLVGPRHGQMAAIAYHDGFHNDTSTRKITAAECVLRTWNGLTGKRKASALLFSFGRFRDAFIGSV